MARPRTPSNILELNGARKANPKRWVDQGRADEPVDDRGLGPAGDLELLTFGQAWDRVVDMCPAGVLRRRDRAIVGQAASLLMDTNNHRVLSILEGRHPMDSAPYMKAMAQLTLVLCRLGMTPTESSKVRAAPKKKANEFDD